MPIVTVDSTPLRRPAAAGLREAESRSEPDVSSRSRTSAGAIPRREFGLRYPEICESWLSVHATMAGDRETYYSRRERQCSSRGRCPGGRSRLPESGRPAAAIPLPEDLLRDRLELQVGRAFVDLADLRVAIQLFDGVVLHESIPAVEIHRERRHALGHLG